MFKYFNPNPIREIAGDCVVRALCKAMGMSWDEAYWAVCFQGFVDGEMPSSNVVWRNLLIKNGFSEHAVKNTCPGCYTVRDFCHDHPVGVYVLFLGGHVCSAINGDYFDAFNSGDEAVIFYFRREW